MQHNSYYPSALQLKRKRHLHLHRLVGAYGESLCREIGRVMLSVWITAEIPVVLSQQTQGQTPPSHFHTTLEIADLSAEYLSKRTTKCA